MYRRSARWRAITASVSGWVARNHCTGLDYHDNQGLLLKTALSGRPVPLTDRSVLGALLRYPLLGLGIVARIHWQALKLWLRQVPFFSKPPAPIHPITMRQEHEQ